MSELFHRLHLPQLEAIKFPSSLISILEQKILNLNNETSIQEYFQIIEEIVEIENDVEEEDNIDSDNEIRKRQLICTKAIGINEDVFILDHVVSIGDNELSILNNYLKDNTSIVERLNDMIIDRKQTIKCGTEDLIKYLIDNLFQYMGCYCFNENNEYNWYILDEVGNAINHSDTPNVVCYPFIYFNCKVDGSYNLISYSILWPIKDIYIDDFITRDYISWINNPKIRAAMLCDWFPDVVDKELIDILIEEAMIYKNTLLEKQIEYHQNIIIPSKHEVINKNKVPSIQISSGYDYVRLWYPSVNKEDINFDPQKLLDPIGGLTDHKFHIVSNKEEADIIWEIFPCKDSNVWHNPKKRSDGFSNVLINQYPYEGAFVMKDHLAREIIKNLGQPNWWNPTYDLEVLLTVFVGDYLLRKKEKLNNTWIIKPANSTRSNGHIVTNSLLRVIRSLETNKSRVAQKFIEYPLLYKGRKFDLRFIVLVRSTFPLELYVYNVFWTRIANKEYDNTNIDDVETVFTAMHLINGIKPIEKYPDYLDFIRHLEEDYPNIVHWDVILNRIHMMIYELFYNLSKGQPQHMKCDHARAMYGVDVMLEQVNNSNSNNNNNNNKETSSLSNDINKDNQLNDIYIQPKLLEVTFSPANNAMSDNFTKKYHTFVNDCFNLLYFGIENNVTRLA